MTWREVLAPGQGDQVVAGLVGDRDDVVGWDAEAAQRRDAVVRGWRRSVRGTPAPGQRCVRVGLAKAGTVVALAGLFDSTVTCPHVR